MKLTKFAAAIPAAALLAIAASSAAMAKSPDAMWIKSAISANRLEIKAGKLAEARSTSPSWQKFGATMAHDHGIALGMLMTLAQDKNVSPPAGLAPKDAAAYKMLARKHGADFDAEYSKFAVISHEQANGLYNKEIAKGQDSDVRAVAGKQLPTVQDHLTMADKMTRTSMKNPGAGVPKP